jgi:hypothetical protein
MKKGDVIAIGLVFLFLLAAVAVGVVIGKWL